MRARIVENLYRTSSSVDGCRFLFSFLSNMIYVDQIAKYMVIEHQHQGTNEISDLTCIIDKAIR